MDLYENFCMTCCNAIKTPKFDYDSELCNYCYNKTYKRCSCCHTIYNCPILHFPKKRNKCITCTRNKEIILIRNPEPYCIFCKKTSKNASFEHSNKICDDHAAEKWKICLTCLLPSLINNHFKNDSRCKQCSRKRVEEYAKNNGLEHFTHVSDEE